ncbi:hypothetical protein [Chimaeribacter californicus]|uniref:hypothetical protein n=1 Tax=Chimaeribacter californicus TaxID=2060067 RepID=UPI0013FCFBA0|nr:hypothetical protein [Chimaeribacter californicus]
MLNDLFSRALIWINKKPHRAYLFARPLAVSACAMPGREREAWAARLVRRV